MPLPGRRGWRFLEETSQAAALTLCTPPGAVAGSVWPKCVRRLLYAG
jgi:hypothetical protein